MVVAMVVAIELVKLFVAVKVLEIVVGEFKPRPFNLQ